MSVEAGELQLQAFGQAYQDGRAILVESVWNVRNAEELRLELAELRSPAPGVETLPLPKEISVVVPLAAAVEDGIVYPRGTARLKPGSRILASVLGTIEPPDNGRVRITPKVVFDPRRA